MMKEKIRIIYSILIKHSIRTLYHKNIHLAWGSNIYIFIFWIIYTFPSATRHCTVTRKRTGRTNVRTLSDRRKIILNFSRQFLCVCFLCGGLWLNEMSWNQFLWYCFEDIENRPHGIKFQMLSKLFITVLTLSSTAVERQRI
jgi:hypothetical protein